MGGPTVLSMNLQEVGLLEDINCFLDGLKRTSAIFFIEEAVEGAR
jgi:hypothetical protein